VCVPIEAVTPILNVSSIEASVADRCVKHR